MKKRTLLLATEATLPGLAGATRAETAPPTYGVLSPIGDSPKVVAYQTGTGTRLDPSSIFDGDKLVQPAALTTMIGSALRRVAPELLDTR